MASCLLLIRHGETAWNQERRFQGFTDIPLSPKGEEQAKALVLALKRVPIARVYCSDLARAVRTAEIIAEQHGLPIQIDLRLREVNHGLLEGKNVENLMTEYPELLTRWMAEPADIEMPEGESLRTAQSRAWEAIQEILDNHAGETVAVVGHNLCLMAVICKALGLDLNSFRRLRIENGSITEIVFAIYGPVLVRINDTHHLTGTYT